MNEPQVATYSQVPFPAAAGRGVRVAVIDSGVNIRHPHIQATTHGIALCDGGQGPSWDDTLGHGTAVTAAIQEKAPDAEYYAVKLFGASLRTTGNRLLTAIEWTIEHRMHVVNLSLGTHNLNYRAELESLIERAEAAGVVFVCARSAQEQPVLPGIFEGVIGVDVDWNLPRHQYRVAGADRAPSFFASGFPRSLPGVPASRNLHGISFAVANMTGFVARACEQLPARSVREVSRALISEARRIQADPPK